MEAKQRWIGPPTDKFGSDYWFEWSSAWVLDIVYPDGSRLHLTHEEGPLPAPIGPAK